MKLNNKGFAITGILYGLLILFALLVGSYLTILTARKNRLDGIVENIENEYNGNTTDTYTLTFKKDTGIKEIYYSKDNSKFTKVNLLMWKVAILFIIMLFQKKDTLQIVLKQIQPSVMLR